MLGAGGVMTDELPRLRADMKASRGNVKNIKRKQKKRPASETLKLMHPW